MANEQVTTDFVKVNNEKIFVLSLKLRH